MPIPSPLQTAARSPATILVALAAVASSLWWWAGHDVQWMMISELRFVSEPWRLITSALPHVDPIHLAFNLYWLWVFGTRIEHAWGPWRLAGLSALLAASSGAAQYALADPGVGLSGVGYGFLGLLYIAQRRVPEFAGAIGPRTLRLFVAWFILCIILTISGTWRVGNVAHAAGAVVGGLVGCAVAAEPRKGSAWIGALVGVFALIGAAATVGRPWVNMSHAPSRSGSLGLQALREGRNAEAATLLETAVQDQPRDPVLWISLGIACQRLGRHADALSRYARAIELDASTRPGLAPAIASIHQHDAYDAAQRSDLTAALAAAQESLRWKDDDAYTWKLLASILAATGDDEQAAKATARAAELDAK